jgi:UPF0716 protein FxsA
MRIPFTLAFLVLVLGEIAVFIWVGEAIGVPATLGLILFGMIAGVMLLRRQGVATLMRVRAEVDAGRTPARPLADGAAAAVAAILVILPGFLTDLLGILLFLPPVRAALFRAVGRRFRVQREAAGGTRPVRDRVIELDQSEYGAQPRHDSPWRHGGRPEA